MVRGSPVGPLESQTKGLTVLQPNSVQDESKAAGRYKLVRWFHETNPKPLAGMNWSVGFHETNLKPLTTSNVSSGSKWDA